MDPADETQREDARLTRALQLCRSRAENISPREYKQMVARLAERLENPGQQNLFYAHADAIYQAALNKRLDKEIQRLQNTLIVVSEELRLLRDNAPLLKGIEDWDQPELAEDIDELPTAEVPASIRNSLDALIEEILDLREDAEAASSVQSMLLPPQPVVTNEAAQLASFYRPADYCGGDWWTAESLPGNKLLIVVADVTGHGTSAAILTGVAKAACDIAVRANPQLTCSELLEQMNRAFYRVVQSEVLMTCVASIIDPTKQQISTANAGHPFPYVLQRGENGNELRQIVVRGSHLGSTPDMEFEIKTQPINPGDLLLWYTDGVIDCERNDGDPFGERRLRTALRQSEASNSVQLRDELVEQMREFASDSIVSDDITLIAGTAFPMTRGTSE
ncbi:MAG: serine/threonine-protein phosphatase [Proteobacteria bacterium]|nr:serine/threonine-protein phosphatase [Pseudomonadota bacterium]